MNGFLRGKHAFQTTQGAFADVNGAMVMADMHVFNDPQHTAFVSLPSFGPEGYSVYEFRDGPRGRIWTSGDGRWRDFRTDPPFIRPAPFFR